MGGPAVLPGAARSAMDHTALAVLSFYGPLLVELAIKAKFHQQEPPPFLLSVLSPPSAPWQTAATPTPVG